jgi:hypothetical protein
VPIGSRGSGFRGGRGPSISARGRGLTGSRYRPVNTLAYRRAERHHIHRRPGMPAHYRTFRHRSSFSGGLFWLIGIVMFVGLLAFGGTIWNSLSRSSGEGSGTVELGMNDRYYKSWSLSKGAQIHYGFSELSGRRVEFLILDDINANAWDNREHFTAEVFAYVASLEGEFTVPHGSEWYVIIHNAWPEPVSISYTIGYEQGGLSLPPALIGIILVLIVVGLIGFIVAKKRTHPTPQELPRPAYPPTSSESSSMSTTEPRGDEGSLSIRESPSKKQTAYISPEKGQYQPQGLPTCYGCGASLEAGERFCLECGKAVKRCQICRGVISFGAPLAACSFCGNEYHEGHIKEWLKVTGECPVCRKRLTQANLTLG